MNTPRPDGRPGTEGKQTRWEKMRRRVKTQRNEKKIYIYIYKSQPSARLEPDGKRLKLL